MVVEHRLARLVQLGIRQSRYFGRAKTRFQLYLAATVANLTLVAAKAGLTGETGSGPPSDWQSPGRRHHQPRRLARANLDPLPARIGLTDQIPLPNKGFTSEFLGRGLGHGFTGHSGRVGMAQDLATTGVELLALMTAGRWKSSRMPARYTERQAAGWGTVARYYQESGG